MGLPGSIPKFVLASASPRRRELLEAVGLEFKVLSVDVDETIKADLTPLEIVDDLALRKLVGCGDLINSNLVITADTLVFKDSAILAKPENRTEAYEMLSLLSGTDHSVSTSVCLGYQKHVKQFNVTTKVVFNELSSEVIYYYLDHYKPYDKAGSYGIQEWIGQIGISKIEGSYTNVVGLPVAETYSALLHIAKNWKIIN